MSTPEQALTAETIATRELPDGLVCYNRTAVFSRQTVPAALLEAHTIKAGVWGVLRVKQGRVRYYMDDETQGSHVISQGEHIVVGPTEPHHVDLLDDDSAFFIEFYRPGQQGQ